MRRLRAWLIRLSGLFNKRQRERELSEELESHLQMHVADNVRAGMRPDEARRQALIKLGGLEQVKENYRDRRGLPLIETLVQDIRYGLRQLRRSPGFTAVAVLTLALGIGANVAIFSLINQTLLRSLPVQHPDELVVLNSTEGKAGSTDVDYDIAAAFSYPMYKDLRDTNRVFSGLLACYPYAGVNVSWQGHVERATAELVSGNFFRVLGVRAALGRVFSQGDETAPGANPVAVLSYGFWTGHFGGNPAVLNQTLVVNATPLTVVGVAQPGFGGIQAGARPDLYIPISMKPQMTPNWNGWHNVSDYFLAVMGRLDPGMSRTQAQTRLQPVFHAILESELPIITANKMITSPEDQKKFLEGKIELTPGARGRPILQYYAQAPLALVMAMVALVLLIACANLAGLLLARGEARQHEIAVRLAMGASRARLVRQLLTESLLVAMAGGGAGLLIGLWTLRSILSAIRFVPLAAIGLSGLTSNLDAPVLAFAAAVAILSVLFFGLLPALRASRADLQTSLKEQGASGSGGAESVRLRKLLVVVQVASTATLLVAAGLFAESLIRLERADVGMRVGHVVQFSIQPGLSHFSPPQTAALLDRMRQDIAALPGVASVSAAEVPLLAYSNNVDTMKFETYVPGKDEDMNVSVNNVSPLYFATLGIPLIEGREFRDGDSSSSSKVAIINKKVAEKFFPGRDPIGMHLAIGWGPDVHPNVEIVGIVANAKSIAARDPGQPFVYFPYAQDSGVSGGTFYVRTRSAPAAMAAALRKVAARDAPNLPVFDVRTLAEQLNDSMVLERLVTFFTLTLALLAALLAVVGLYGVMAYVAIRRTREVAIRIALGAQKADVLRLVVRQGFKLTLIGVVIGIAAALGLTRFLATLLYGVKATDPLTFIAVSVMLTLAALLACYIPARRAAKVDPMVALRYE
jgi:putative ABC transport system permease protein